MSEVINMDRIHMLKRKQVADCVDIARRHPKVRRMIVFGSTVTEHCTEQSDVDICLDINGTTNGLDMFALSRDMSWACDHHCDILTYGKLRGTMKHEVDQKGVTVYELS